MRIHSSDHSWLLLAILVILLSISGALSSDDKEKKTKSVDKKKEVTYDGTSLIINGNRELLYSGSIHYPRSTPEVKDSYIP